MDLQCISAAEQPELPEEGLDRDRLTYAAWGKGLTLQQYLDREMRLWRHPFSRAGMRRWILRDGAEALASCESYAVPVHVDQTVGVGHGVASVYVEERRRGQGLAAALLQQVHRRFEREGALCSYLMSEIGPTLYERLGYVARPPQVRRFAPAGPQERQPATLSWLTAADVPALLERRYQHRPRSAQVALRLTPEQLDWHVVRGRIYAEHLGRPYQRVVGARAGDAFGLYAAYWQKNALRVLMLYPGEKIFAAGTNSDPHAEEAALLRDVLHGARFLAAELDLASVEIWENGANAGWLRGGARLTGADIPMLRPAVAAVRAQEWLDWECGHWL